uniref:Sushi domain-containing protein n=1 Tax=Plectus sambesii TaxID=2011161 RepID=A0A914UH50_9BILA
MPALCERRDLLSENILQQDNWLGGLAPAGYKKIDIDSTKMYCVRWLGDCGATVPIYRYFIYVGTNGWSHTYSLDTEVDYAGYTRELFPICYGWPAPSTTTAANEGIAADKLVTLSTYVNSFTGANRDHWTTIWTPSINESAFDGYTWLKDVTRVASSLSASTDTLQCNSLVKVIQMYDYQVGWDGTEKSPGLFSRFDHKVILESQMNGKEANLPFENYTATGEYFYCVLSQGSCGATVALKKWFNGFEIDTIYTVTDDDDPLFVRNDGVLCYTWPLDSSSASGCVAATSVTNGQISYSQSSTSGRYTQGTTATLTCTSGYTLSGTASLTCVGSSWSPTTFGSCAAQVCPALTTNSFGTITYSQTTNSIGTTAVLTCTDPTNYQVLGT